MRAQALKDILVKCKPFWGMVYFAGMLFLTHYAWKYSFTESLQTGGVPQIWLWQTFDCSLFFDNCVDYLVSIVDWTFADVFGIEGYRILGHHFYILEPSRSVIGIVWGCTGLKQLFIMTTMILCYPYGHKQKWWAILVFGALVLLVNIFRLEVLFYHTMQNPSDFEQWHEGSKYVVYAIMFGFWIVWEEIVRKHAAGN